MRFGLKHARDGLVEKKVLIINLNPAIDVSIECKNIQMGKVNNYTLIRKDAGGKGINVATALSNMGIGCTITGFLGIHNSILFKEHFIKNKIEDCMIYYDGYTRENFKIVNTEDNSTTDINSSIKTDLETSIEVFWEQYVRIHSDFSFVVITGSIPLGINTNIYEKIAKIAKKPGSLVLVDTSGNILLDIIKSGYVDLIKPNIDEFNQINLTPSEILKNVKTICLTKGGKGCEIITNEYLYESDAPKLSIKSSVGAGDAFLAGYIYGLCNNLDGEELCKTAVSWASSKLSHYGSGLSESAPPDSFMDKISVKKTSR